MSTFSLGQERTLTDAVYQRLRESILKGQLPPGERLDQQHICDQFEISRTPLREVLRRLEAEGLVVIRSHRGALVARLSLRDADEIYSIRVVLEGHAARLAAQRVDPERVARLQACVDEMAEATARRDFDRLVALRRDFHLTLSEGAGNHQMLELIGELRGRCEWFRRVSVSLPERAEVSLAQHSAILEAYAAGDGPRVEALVRQNLEHSRELIAQLLDKTDGERLHEEG